MFAFAEVAEREIIPRAAIDDTAIADGLIDGALESAFQATGGVAEAEEIASLLRRRCEQPLSQLARWIVSRQVVHFERWGQTLMPLFQFDLDSVTIRPEVRAVLDELGATLEPHDVARWFVTPNSRLAGDTPVRRLATDAAGVAEAARSGGLATTGCS